jgi:hypothetical protein
MRKIRSRIFSEVGLLPGFFVILETSRQYRRNQLDASARPFLE